MLGLYESPGEAEKAISELAAEKSELLDAIYEHHSVLPIAPCFDEFEALLVIDRLFADRASLRQAWPLESDELESVADAIGVRLVAA